MLACIRQHSNPATPTPQAPSCDATRARNLSMHWLSRTPAQNDDCETLTDIAWSTLIQINHNYHHSTTVIMETKCSYTDTGHKRSQKKSILNTGIVESTTHPRCWLSEFGCPVGNMISLAGGTLEWLTQNGHVSTSLISWQQKHTWKNGKADFIPGHDETMLKC